MRDAQRQLIGRLLSGDRTAGDAFVREWGRRIVAWVRRDAPAHLIDEYSQEVLLHLCRNNWASLSGWRGLYSGEDWHPNSLAGYLKSITAHKVNDLIDADNRRLPAGGEYRDVVEDGGALGINPADSTADAGNKALLRECINTLQPKDRNLLYLWRQGEPDSYTAQLLDMNANNVRQRRHYLTKKLIECVENRRRGN